jgi:hypothetical protein
MISNRTRALVNWSSRLEAVALVVLIAGLLWAFWRALDRGGDFRFADFQVAAAAAAIAAVCAGYRLLALRHTR